MENEPIRMMGYGAAGVAALISLLIAVLPISEGKKVTLLSALAVSVPLVAAKIGRDYVAPLGPNREQAGEGHPAEALHEEWTPDGGGGPEALPDEQL